VSQQLETAELSLKLPLCLSLNENQFITPVPVFKTTYLLK